MGVYVTYGTGEDVHKWFTNYGGMDASMMLRMKELEDES